MRSPSEVCATQERILRLDSRRPDIDRAPHTALHRDGALEAVEVLDLDDAAPAHPTVLDFRVVGVLQLVELQPAAIDRGDALVVGRLAVQRDRGRFFVAHLGIVALPREVRVLSDSGVRYAAGEED